MKVVCMSYFLALFTFQLNAQFGATPQHETSRDTIFYPFSNGKQLIEIDHLRQRAQKIVLHNYGHQAKAIPDYAYWPKLMGNEFVIRDSSGQVLKTYNSSHSLEYWNTLPLDHSYDSFLQVFKTREELSIPYIYNQRFIQSFKVSNKNTVWYIRDNPSFGPQIPLMIGLIDYQGDEIIPIEYEQIEAFGTRLLVKKKGKIGLINYTSDTLVSLRYSDYLNIYLGKDTFIFFKKGNEFVGFFSTISNTFFSIHPVLNVRNSYIDSGCFSIRVGNKYGLLSTNGKVLLPPVYDKIYNMNVTTCEAPCAKVIKDGNVFFEKLNNKE